MRIFCWLIALILFSLPIYSQHLDLYKNLVNKDSEIKIENEQFTDSLFGVGQDTTYGIGYYVIVKKKKKGLKVRVKSGNMMRISDKVSQIVDDPYKGVSSYSIPKVYKINKKKKWIDVNKVILFFDTETLKE